MAIPVFEGLRQWRTPLPTRTRTRAFEPIPTAEAKAMYQRAYDLATGHNPPAAFVRPFVRKTLALPGHRQP